MAQVTRRIWLCADDYGLAPGVNKAIRELILRERLNATSVMMVSPHIGGEEANALKMLNTGTKRAAVGLHITLTGRFRPLSANFTPLRDGCFLPLHEMGRLAITRRLQPDTLTAEIASQLQAFIAAFGHLPDFFDGHQHVHLLPQIRDAFLRVVAEIAPHAWVRQCGRADRPIGAARLRDPKAFILDLLSVSFRQRAERLGLATNSAFAGTYSFTTGAQFARIFSRFLEAMPDRGLIMCHPGFADAALEALDPLTKLREHEFAFFSSDAFPRTLLEAGIALAKPSGG